MAITITLPELGEGVDSVDVVAVLVAVGDAIELDQGLIEVETEKASVEVPATVAGTVTEIHVQTGDILGENAPIVTLDAAESEAEPATEEIAPVSEPEIAEEKRTERVENPKSEIRNDMMTGSSYEPSQNVILSEARCRRAKSKDL